jgi:glycosyltransferase involved in cell wall biosynthesis
MASDASRARLAADQRQCVVGCPTLSVVIPCYNDGHAIADTLRALQDCLADAGSYEIIVVNDGSTDRTSHIVREMMFPENHLRLLEHDHNRGYGAALKTGIRASCAPLIVITDSDGTYPFNRLPDMLRLAREADMVVGARARQAAGHSWLRGASKFLLRQYCSFITGCAIPDMNSGLRVFRRDVIDRYVRILPDGFSFTTTATVALMSQGYDVRFLEIDYLPRRGRSKIHPLRDTLAFIQLILRTGAYFAPLKVFLPMAVLIGGCALASLLWDIVAERNLTDKTVLLLLSAINTGMFALLADMIDKRSQAF